MFITTITIALVEKINCTAHNINATVIFKTLDGAMHRHTFWSKTFKAQKLKTDLTAWQKFTLKMKYKISS